MDVLVFFEATSVNLIILGVGLWKTTEMKIVNL